MGSGIDAAGMEPELAKALDDMKDQLLLVLVNRLGGKVSIPASEIDDTGQYLMTMELIPGRSLEFKVIKKS